MEEKIVVLNGTEYKLVELSARKYQSIMNSMKEQMPAQGEGEAKLEEEKGGLNLSIALLSASLKADDGSYAPEDQLWDLPIKQVQSLSQDVMDLNGMTQAAKAADAIEDTAGKN